MRWPAATDPAPDHLRLPENSLQRLGTLYVRYRLVLALVLFAILSMTLEQYAGTTLVRSVYVISSCIYLLLALGQIFAFQYFSASQPAQLFGYLICDVLYISLLLMMGVGPTLAVVLLFMLVVLAATLLLSRHKALFLTLLIIIIVLYQQFFLTIFGDGNVAFLGNSALIALMFMSIYLIGQITMRRMQVVETLAQDQSHEIIQLQSINQRIIEQLDTGCMVLDATGRVLTINKAARLLLDLPVLDAQMPTPLLSGLEPQLAQQLDQRLAQRREDRFYYVGDPEHLHEKCWVHYQPLHDDEQALVLVSFESIQRSNQQAQQLKLMALGQLSASIAHEIRNPLAIINQANELLRDELQGEANAEQRLLGDMVHKQCQRIDRIISDTLSMSRQPHTQPEPIVLAQWLQQCIREDLTDVQQWLQLRVDDQPVVLFDVQHLRQVMINLIRNAIRHGHEHAPDSLVTIAASRHQQTILIDILDQGSGVSAELQHQLFEPFFSTAINGTGLGLYLCKTLCEANHATLSYIPRAQGACFRLECLIPQR